MMKKLVVTILALVYISSSIGANIHLHYCMGKMADWGLRRNDSKKCCKCMMEIKNEKENSCCNYGHQFLKNSSGQNTPDAALQVTQALAANVPAAIFEIPATKFPSIPQENLTSFNPARSYGVAIYIFDRSFLI